MSQDKVTRRRAVVTGLSPFMDQEALLKALQHWEQHYANSPRFTLQKFVAEIAREGSMQAQRSSMLLSLVKAMHLPLESLLPDPVAVIGENEEAQESIAVSAAFTLIMNNLVKRIPAAAHYQFCQDLLGSLAHPRLGSELIRALEDWLGKDRPLRIPPSSPLILRALVNRAYVLLCERLGPVEADQLLAQVVNTCQRARPDLDNAVTCLL